MGERFADAVGPELKVCGHTPPFKTHAPGTCSELCSPIIFFLCSHISLPVLFRIRSAITSCAHSPPDSPPP
jgi:hypothetical protein